MRRRTILNLMWLGCVVCCAPTSFVFAIEPAADEQQAANAIRAGQAVDLNAIPVLADALSHESRLVRQSSAWALSQMGSSISDAAPMLTQALADQDAKVRWAAATSLGHLGRAAWRAESALWQSTLDRDVDVRCAALIALRTVSVSNHSAALGTLSECLQSSVADVQSETVATIATIQSRWDESDKRRLVPHLARTFATANDDVRLAVAALLGDLGLSAAPAIPEMATAADDLDEHVRAAALRALGRFAEEVDQRWNQLDAVERAALRRPCELAEKSLGSQGRDSAEVKGLAEQFRQLIDGIQLTSAEVSPVKPTILTFPTPDEPSPLKNAPRSTSPLTDLTWQWALAGLGMCVGLWALWRGLSRRNAARSINGPLPVEETAARNQASISSQSYGSPSPCGAVDLAFVTNHSDHKGLGDRQAELLSSSLQALRNDDAKVRQAAAVTLGQIGLGAIDAVPQLTAALSDAESRVRAAAAFALSAFGPHAMEAVPELRTALSDEFPAVRARAAFALGQIGPAARRAADELARLVSDPDVLVRRNSASALGGIGADTAVALPALRQAAGDSDPGVCRCAVTALRLIVAEAEISDGITACSPGPCGLDDSQTERNRPSHEGSGYGENNFVAGKDSVRSASGLKMFSPEVSDGAEATIRSEHALDATDFIARLEDADGDVRWKASQELSRLGGSAVPEMIAALNHRNPELRRLLIHALGRVGGTARACVPSLLVALHDVNADVRSAAADCLGRFGVVSRPMVQELRQSLSDWNSEVRRYAATTLGRFGQHASEAMTALQVTAISDSAAKVRVAAQAALHRISESLAGAA